METKFTDEDLKRLKGFIEEQKEIELPDVIFWFQIESLLARLEAAEACITGKRRKFRENWKVWRKSAGK